MYAPLGLGANAIGGHNLFPNLDEEEGKGNCADGAAQWDQFD